MSSPEPTSTTAAPDAAPGNQNESNGLQRLGDENPSSAAATPDADFGIESVNLRKLVLEEPSSASITHGPDPRSQNESNGLHKLADELAEIKVLLKQVLNQRHSIAADGNLNHTVAAGDGHMIQLAERMKPDPARFDPVVLRKLAIEQLPTWELLVSLRNHFLAIFGVEDILPIDNRGIYFNKNERGARKFFHNVFVDIDQGAAHVQILTDEKRPNREKDQRAQLVPLQNVAEDDNPGNLARLVRDITPKILQAWPTTLGGLVSHKPSEDVPQSQEGDSYPNAVYQRSEIIFSWNIEGTKEQSEARSLIGDYLVSRTDLTYTQAGFLHRFKSVALNRPVVMRYLPPNSNKGSSPFFGSEGWDGYVFGHVWYLIRSFVTGSR
jgi:hypothetical protein